MTSKIVVNNIEPDAGISTVTVVGNVESTKFVGAVEGSVTGNVTGNLTGTASTSTNAATAYAIDSAASLNTSGIVTATSFVPTVGQLSHRNVIINGDAKISQRATSQGSITSGGYYTVDRWYVTMDTAGTWTMYQDADVPSGYGFSKSVSLDVNTANTSLSAGSRAMLSYRLEGQDVQRFCKGTANAKKYALSFWVKCGKTGTYVLELFDHDNSRHICKTYTISSANTWEQKKLIFDNETSNPFGNDNGKSLELQFYLAAGSNFTSGTLATSWASNTNANRAVGQVNVADSTSNKYFLTGVQLEVGSVATPFEHRSFADELKRCQRYYYKSNRWMGGARGSSTARSFVTDFGMRLTGNQVSGGTYTNEATSGGDVVYIGSNATRQNSDVNANSMGASTTSSNGSLQLGVTVGYALGSGDNGIATGLFINGFTIDHEL